jgi:hypothetical protein
MPNKMSEILEKRDRIYFKRPSQYDEHHGLLKQKLTESSHINSNEINQEAEEEKETILDLGLEPLHRILFEMKKLGVETTSYQFDANAAKSAGLKNYCEYIHDKNVKIRKPAKDLTLSERIQSSKNKKF